MYACFSSFRSLDVVVISGSSDKFNVGGSGSTDVLACKGARSGAMTAAVGLDVDAAFVALLTTDLLGPAVDWIGAAAG